MAVKERLSYDDVITIISMTSKVLINEREFTRDGNAFALLGQFKHHARRQGWSNEDINQVMEDAKSGDYSHLVSTLMSYIELTDK